MHGCESILEGIRLDAVWSRLPVIMVSDCASVIQALAGNEHCISRLCTAFVDWVLYSVKFREAETLTDFKFMVAKREQNRAAHETVAFVCQTGVVGIWDSVFPDIIAHEIDTDCNAQFQMNILNSLSVV
ncbi:hypothetical protein VPH35_039840 [Triticum aestivum]|uniref:RNase H type-1 domain-containing protein n=1 Tax=Aegilops tauschii subsp. strangulata TaxID=200361 RepID=A0A453CYR5_AEGTS